MPNLIYLGNFNHITTDPTEGNYTSENAHSLEGISTDSTQMSIVHATAYDNGDGVISDDEFGTSDYIQYDLGGDHLCTYTDSTMTANVTLTLSDGSTQQVEVVVMQQTNGDLFISDLLNGGTLDNLSIANVQIDEITEDCASGWYSDQSVDNSVIAPVAVDLDGTVSGTSGDDIIDVSYLGDPDGDRVDNGDAILAGDVGDDDLIVAGAGDDSVAAGEGDDLVFGGTGNDVIDGGDGDDTLCGQDGDDVLHGGTGDDILEGMNDNDLLYGDAGNDSLYGDAGSDTLFGGSGDDLVKGGAGDDILVGDGADTAGTTEFLVDWDQLGSDGNQTLTVDGQSVNVSVGTPQNAQGKEWFVENGMLKNWDVTDPTTADMHFNTAVSHVKFTLLDVDGLDKITIMAKDAAGNLVEVSFEDTGVHTVTGNMVTGSQTNAPGPGAANNGQDVEVTIAGPIQHLWIVLDNGAERDYSGTVAVTDITFEIPAIADGVDGNDVLHGGDGNDEIYGNGGDDVLFGGTGDDFLLGGDGNDTISGEDGDDTLCGQDGDDTLFGGAGNDILEGMNDNDVLFGGAGADTIYADAGDDIAEGGAGSDDMYGGTGDDTLAGGGGDDCIEGGSGDDLLIGDGGTGIGGANLLMNGAMESDITPGTYSFGQVAGWTGTAGYIERWGDGFQGENSVDGGDFVELDSHTEVDGIYQDVVTSDGDSYTLAFSAMQRIEGSDDVVEVYFGGVLIDTVTPGDEWQQYTYSVTGSGADRLEFREPASDNSTYGPLLDNVSLITADDSEAGNDKIDGGTGDDEIFGNAGADTLTGGDGADDIYGGSGADTIFGGVGDTVDGGNAGDDNDVLDLTGQGAFVLTGPDGTGDPIPDSNGNGLDGQVVFVDGDGNPTGDVLDFTEIEQIIGDDVTNADPDAIDDGVDAGEDAVSDLGNVLTNDLDPNDDDLIVGAVNGDEALVGTPVAGSDGGLVTINADGTASFDPNGEFEALGEGETATTTVTYTVDDGNGGTDTATVTVTVTGTNDAPDATVDTYVSGQDADGAAVLGNVIRDDTGAGADSDPEGDTIRVTSVTNGTDTSELADPFGATGQGMTVEGDNGGLVTINNAGNIFFDANGAFGALGEGETATTSVTYTLTDENGAADTATVTITVNGANDGPNATDNAYVVSLSETAGDVDGNVITQDTGAGVDSDPEGDALTVVAVDGDAGNVGNAVAGDAGGTFTINDDGTVDFDAGDDFDDLGLGATRDTSVSYTIVDENGAEDTASVTFTVTGINDGTVQGTDGADVINPDIPYVDADGDIVDAGDGILPGDEGTDNDVIEGFGGDDSIAAGNGADVVFGGTGDDTIKGNLGDDVLFGGADNDNVQGGLGNDLIDGGAGDDLLLGGSGDDTVRGGAGEDRIFGAEGDDELRGGSENDTIEGSEGEDTLYGGTGDDDLWGGLDDDTVIGGAGNDTVAGEDGDDDLHGGFGDDIIDGGAGNDVIVDVEGSDNVFGGDGDDVINVGSTQGDEAPDVGYPEQPSATIPGLTFPGYDADEDPNDDKDFVDGGAGNDIINTGDDDDSIIGGSGNDTINAGFDDDTVDGGTGDDFIEGGEGNDIVEGGDGDDVIYGGLANPFADLVSFPDDELDAAGFQDLVPENNGDELFGGAGNDTIFGQDDDDSLFGGDGDDILDGGVDDDLLVGGDGNDILIGGQGNDSLDGGAGEDTIFGGAGDDTVTGGQDGDDIFGGAGNDSLEGRRGDDVISGDDGDDKIVGNGGDDSLFGGAGNDDITGGEQADYIEAGDGDDDVNATDGDDVVFGGAGNDDLEGGLGNDTIDGGEGTDLIYGGAGVDDLSGGFGSDTFLGGNGGDVVTGGEDADNADIDVLDLTGSNVQRIDYVDGDPEAGTVTFQDGSTMTFSEIENVIPCFTPGTLIATPKGERLVEELQVGDRIITRDNGIQEIAWLGHKPMSGAQLVQNPHLQPVLIKRGALGHGLPERDMMVSPNHRVLVSSDKTQLYFEENEVLAAAKHMVGAEGIHTVNVLRTTYVHFMFERHEVVLSNGAWTESFQPGDYSLKGIGNSQRNEIFDLFPELSTKTGLENYQSARKALKKHEAKLLLK
jgi:Ca2+-binding RTX toxin-like protein